MSASNFQVRRGKARLGLTLYVKVAVLSTLGDRPSLHDPHSLDSFSGRSYDRRDFQILKLFSVSILDLSSYSKFAVGECGVGYVS